MLHQPIRALLLLRFSLAFCSFLGQGRTPEQEFARAKPTSAEVKDFRLVARQVGDIQKKRVEIHELLETKPQHLMPSNKFDVECEIVGGKDDFIGDYFVWTTVDFLVAPLTRAYEQMDDATLGGWPTL